MYLSIGNRVFSHDVTAAILVFQNNKTAAMLVSQTSPMGVKLFSFFLKTKMRLTMLENLWIAKFNAFFSYKFAYLNGENKLREILFQQNREIKYQ